jgi:hypothetical protein
MPRATSIFFIRTFLRKIVNYMYII